VLGGVRRSAKPSAIGDRLLYPMIRCSKGTMERVAWTDASTMSRIALRISSSAMARTRWRSISPGKC